MDRRSRIFSPFPRLANNNRLVCGNDILPRKEITVVIKSEMLHAQNVVVVYDNYVWLGIHYIVINLFNVSNFPKYPLYYNFEQV